MKTFKIGGIHPDAAKLTAAQPIHIIDDPDVLTLMLGQSIGKPAKAVVKAGDIVAQGQLIAEADGVMSANVHAPRAGKVSKLAKVRNPQGYWSDAIIIDVDHTADPVEYVPMDAAEVEALDSGAIIDAIRRAGIVGMGGAAFPTAVKLTPPQGMVPDVLIINGAECEPYLTCDDRLMREEPDGIVRGAHLLMRAIGVSRCMIGIEHNKPEAISAMSQAAQAFEGIEVVTLKTKYPQGGEKQLITALTGREVPSGQLPVSVGAIVDNVATAFAVYEAVYLRKPLIERVLTVTGPDLDHPGNLRAPIGTALSHLINLAGGCPESAELKVVAGGPMMGRAVKDTDSPSVKATSGLLVLDGKAIERPAEQNCIRCGRCLNACPMGLEPYLFIAQARRQMWPEMKQNFVMDCIECGSCSWSCPAHKPLLDFIKLGKLEIRKRKL